MFVLENIKLPTVTFNLKTLLKSKHKLVTKNNLLSLPPYDHFSIIFGICRSKNFKKMILLLAYRVHTFGDTYQNMQR